MNYLLLLLIGIIGIFYYDTFGWLIESWTNNPYYSHGFLVPVISLYFIWRARKDLAYVEKEEFQKGLMVFLVGLILQGIAVMYVIRFMSGLSLVITIFGTLLYIYGWKFTKKISFPIMLLLLAVPVPFVDTVAPPVQTISAVTSAGLVNMLGIPIERDGLILNTPKGSFEVALECSGLRSVISLLTLSIIYAFILEGGLLMKSVIVLSSIPLAIIGNILRITSVLGVANIYGEDTAINYFHDLSSLLLFTVALIGLFLIGRLFGKLKFRR